MWNTQIKLEISPLTYKSTHHLQPHPIIGSSYKKLHSSPHFIFLIYIFAIQIPLLQFFSETQNLLPNFIYFISLFFWCAFYWTINAKYLWNEYKSMKIQKNPKWKWEKHKNKKKKCIKMSSPYFPVSSKRFSFNFLTSFYFCL